MAELVWRRSVNANNSNPEGTDLNFRPGARITIVSHGFANYGGRWAGPGGEHGLFRNDAKAPTEPIGALLVKNGNIYTSVGGGLLNWPVHSDDNVEFVINDRQGGYGDNTGGFEVEMAYSESDLLR